MQEYRVIRERVLAAELASGEWLILPDGGEPVEVPAELFRGAV